MDNARIVQRIVVFDQPERVFNAVQAGVGLTFRSPDPKPVEVPARRKPEGQPVDGEWFPRWLYDERYAARLLLRIRVPQASTPCHGRARPR